MSVLIKAPSDAHAHDVIVGLGGVLFLNEGSNENFTYCSFQKRFDQEKLASLYSGMLRSAAATRDNGANYSAIIFPNKETICWGSHPLKADLSEPQSAGRIMKSLDSHGIIHFDAPQDSALFFKTDSHFNAAGNLRWSYEMARQADPVFARDVDFATFSDRIKLVTREFSGDLGNRFSPEHREMADLLTVVPKSISKTSNGIGNRGFIELIQNPSAPYTARLLIFGDSFARNLRYYLAHWFKQIVFIHTTFFCLDLVELFRPNIVFQTYVERFLSSPPSPIESPCPFDDIGRRLSKETPALDMRALIEAARATS